MKCQRKKPHSWILNHYFSSRMSVFDCATPSPPIEVFQFGREFAAQRTLPKRRLALGWAPTGPTRASPGSGPVSRRQSPSLPARLRRRRLPMNISRFLGWMEDGFTKAATNMLSVRIPRHLPRTELLEFRYNHDDKVHFIL